LLVCRAGAAVKLQLICYRKCIGSVHWDGGPNERRCSRLVGRACEGRRVCVARIEPLYRHFRGIISVQIPRPIGSIALVATLLVWWCAGVGVPTNTARADDCLTAPNSPAPAGSHWYFRTDRAKQRNCWYLHTPDQPPQPAAAQAISDAPPATHTIAFKKPATASPSAPSVNTSPGDSAAPPLPPVKPQGAPMSSATTDQPVRQSAQEGSSATSIPDAPAPQANPSSSTQGAEPAPATATVRPDPPTVAAVKAQELAPVSSESVRPTAGARASDDAQSTARDGGSTANAAGTAASVTARPWKLEIRM
jgi:hypothetical protein